MWLPHKFFVYSGMIKLDLDKFKDLEHALKVFKKKVRNTKVMEGLKEKQYFTKPSVKKRKQLIKAKHINKKRNGGE